jgi:hypothetical protein
VPAVLALLLAAGAGNAGTAAQPPPPLHRPWGALTLGLHMDLTYEVGATDRTRAVALAKAVHAKISRNSLLWHQIEERRGTRDWGRTDTVVDELVHAGIEPLMAVYGSPCWANESARSDPACHLYVPVDEPAFAAWIAGYRDFVAAAAARYRGRVKKWELWNEQNDIHFWKPGPDVNRYLRWFRAIADTIKMVDPEAEVASGGLSGLCCTGPAGIDGFAFLRRLYEQDASPDAVAIHPYSDHAPDVHVPHHGNFDDIATVRDIMVAAGQGAKPIWVTEWGWGTDKVSEREQAVYVARSLAMLVERYPYVTVATLFVDRDRPPAYHQGLYAADGRLKPAGDAFRAFAGAR